MITLRSPNFIPSECHRKKSGVREQPDLRRRKSMDGANRKFIEKKEPWLENHIIFYNVFMGAANPYNQPLAPATPTQELPIQDFDLRKIPAITKSSGAVVKAYQLYDLNQNIIGTTPRKTGMFTNPL